MARGAFGKPTSSGSWPKLCSLDGHGLQHQHLVWVRPVCLRGVRWQRNRMLLPQTPSVQFEEGLASLAVMGMWESWIRETFSVSHPLLPFTSTILVECVDFWNRAYSCVLWDFSTKKKKKVFTWYQILEPLSTFKLVGCAYKIRMWKFCIKLEDC